MLLSFPSCLGFDGYTNDSEHKTLLTLLQDENEEPQSPLLKLASWKFLLQLSDDIAGAEEKVELKAKMMAQIKEKSTSCICVVIHEVTVC